MNTNFDNLPWHDATLKTISIDRQKPGENDVIRLLIEWPSSNHLSLIEFYDCYAFKATMNFGIIGTESILQAQCITNSPELTDTINQWKKMNIILMELKCYLIITNSTNSSLKIFSKNFSIKESLI